MAIQTEAATMPAREVGPSPELISSDPTTGKEIGRVPLQDRAAVEAAVARGRAVQPAWAALPTSGRIAYLRRIRRVLAAHADDIATLTAQEMGKHPVEALGGDVLFALTHLDYAIRHSTRLLRPQRVRHGVLWATRHAEVVLEPRGVIGIISPYNYPVLMTANTLFLALAAGNVVVAKPSEHTPLVGQRLAELCLEAGLPRHVFQVVTGDHTTGAALVESPIDSLVFVGGTSTGRKIAATAAAKLLPVTMELGGSNAMIVLRDADLPMAARAAVWGGLVTSGQVCGRVARVLVDGAVAKPFLDLLDREVRQLRAGGRHVAEFDLGPLTTLAGLTHARAAIDEALATGARVLAGGLPAADALAPGEACSPVVLAGVRAEMRVMREELFAPVLLVHEVGSAAEAVRVANDSPYSLTASVWGRNRRRAWAVARRIHAGSVVVNDHIAPALAAESPWGGMGGASGYGRIGGPHGLLGLTHPKYISYDRLPVRRYPWWFPYTPDSTRFFHRVLAVLYGRTPAVRLRGLADLLRDPSALIRLFR